MFPCIPKTIKCFLLFTSFVSAADTNSSCKCECLNHFYITPVERCSLCTKLLCLEQFCSNGTNSDDQSAAINVITDCFQKGKMLGMKREGNTLRILEGRSDYCIFSYPNNRNGRLCNLEITCSSFHAQDQSFLVRHSQSR